MSQVKLQKVIDKGLCTRCGACVGLSDGKITFEDKTGKYLPVIHEKLTDEEADRIWKACSGKEVNWPELTKTSFPENDYVHPYLGAYRELNIGYATDFAVRRAAGSAGVITTTLLYLLEKGKIDGAVVLGMDEKEPWHNKPYIATSKEEILRGTQSKYTISSNNELLAEMEKFEGRLAYVGLPCQVHSIRKLQAANDPAVRNIEYIVAPYCGLNLHFSSVTSFLRAHGAKDHTQITDLKFREGEWPGHMRVEMKDGKVMELRKFFANYLIPFHIMKRCWYCVDGSNEFADISVGDAWAPVYEERGKGFSIVVSRSEKGTELLHSMKEEGLIDLIPQTEDEAVKMHSHMFDNKKRGAFIRIDRKRHKPEYNLPKPENIKFGRKVFESVLQLIYAILRTRLMTWIVDKLPSEWVGRNFDRFKVYWKKRTYKVKRDEL
ncbi:MAG: coenzyme F420 hydrogenase [Marinilabiliales bacterium]|nr:MAG: coenzyme F420 hydrogenase [Marinilabiliales bacterium]